MKVWYIIGVVVLVLLAGAGGFFGGTVYAQSQSQSAQSNFLRQRAAGGNGQFGQGGQGGAGQFGQGRQGGQGGAGGQFAQFGQLLARGQIKSVSADGQTVEISTAQSVVTVKVDSKTIINKTVSGTTSDLKPGDRVTVFAPANGDQSTASAIQIQGMQGQ